MAHLQIKMQEPVQSWWQPFFKWIEDNTILFLCFGLSWKGVDRAFRYLSNTQAERIKEIVKKEINDHVTPQIDRLSDNINKLQESIWALRDKI